MKITPTYINDVRIIDLEPRSDERGYFSRVYCHEELKKSGIEFNIVQINRSLTNFPGTIRGMHYQNSPKSEDKIVQCLKGEIFDVAIDLRVDSPTFGQWVGELLNETNMKMLLVPKGFAHGFQSLREKTVVEYFVSEYYSPAYEAGIRWNDPLFNINWPIKEVTLSSKDGSWPDFRAI